MLPALPLAGVAAAASDVESAGYAALWSAEITGDPFLPLVSAAAATTGIELGTGVAVAFARSPMVSAYSAWELQRLSGGRFVLGLGTQVKPHVTRRFGMPWSAPAARMREYLLALRAIWNGWRSGELLAFHGEFYRHDLMPPAFVPEPLPVCDPTIVLAAVGERMCEVAGECADGVFVHPLSSPRYLEEFVLPALERGRTRSGAAATVVCGSPLIASGADAEAVGKAVEGVRRQIAFYASTPTYRPVFDLHGWGDAAVRLHELSRSRSADAWTEMGSLVTDEMVDQFAVVAPIADLADALTARFDGVLDRVQIYAPYDHNPALWEPVVRQVNRPQEFTTWRTG